MTKQIYLDYAAATPMDSRVIKAMGPYFSDKFYNPSATYIQAQKVRQDLDHARSVIASWFGAKPAEVIFTAGATEANNLAIKGVMEGFPDGEVVVSAIEHESVLEPAKLYKHRLLPVSSQGVINLEALKTQISNHTVLVSVIMVNNELGTVQPLKEIAAIITDVRKKRQAQGRNLPLYFHTDAAQAPNYFDLHVSRLGVDLLTINGGKIYGPKQSGVLFTKSGVSLKPLLGGGGQERGLRGGTENVAAAIGLATALDIAQKQRFIESQRLLNIRGFFISEISELPGSTVNGAKKNQSPHIASVTLRGQDNERLMIELDEAGVQVAVGSACSASNDQPSHVLSAIGLSDSDAQSTLRFSFGRQTTKEQITTTVKTLQKLL